MLTAVLTFEAQLAQRCRLWVKFGSRPASLPTAFLSPALRNRPVSPASTPTSAMTCQRVKNHSSLAAWRAPIIDERCRD